MADAGVIAVTDGSRPTTLEHPVNLTTASTAPTTRRVTLSARNVAEEGSRYTDAFVGLIVAHTTASGDVLTGVVESFTNPVTGAVGWPVIRFADGRWARGTLELAVIV